MTSDLAFTVFRIGYLVLLWLLVLGAVNTLRRDVFGTVVTPRGRPLISVVKRIDEAVARLETLSPMCHGTCC